MLSKSKLKVARLPTTSGLHGVSGNEDVSQEIYWPFWPFWLEIQTWTLLTWIVFEVLKVDIRDVLMLHQVNSQCVLSTVDLVVGACKISNQFQFLTIMIFGYDWLTDWLMEYMMYLRNRKLPGKPSVSAKIAGFIRGRISRSQRNVRKLRKAWERFWRIMRRDFFWKRRRCRRF